MSHWQQQPDHVLMTAFTQGQAKAFEELYQRHEGPMFRFIRRVLGREVQHLAEEVFQDTWMKVIAAQHTYTANASAQWKSWAFAIAYNTCMDRLRQSGREYSLDAMTSATGDESADPHAEANAPLDWVQTQLQPSHLATPPSTEDLAHWRAAGQQLLHCLEQLPVVQRTAFLLHHEDGHSLQDLAHMLQTGAETVKSRLRYAMNKLRGCMAQYLSPTALAEGTAPSCTLN